MPFKLIRELREGRPMTYKTGAVIGSYPYPMLVLSGDPHGMTIVPAIPTSPTSPFKMQFTTKDIEYKTLNEVIAMSQLPREQLPKCTVFQFSLGGSNLLTDLYQPTPDLKSFPDFNRLGNALVSKCPWKTVIVDPITELQNVIFAHLAGAQSGLLATPMKWAPAIGMKVINTLSTFHRLSAHLVAIFHTSTPDKDETTSVVSAEPILFGAKARDAVGGIFAQVFAAEIMGGKPMVFTQSTGYYKGIGAKWPHGLPATCGADFDSIYGNAVKAGELER